MAGWSPPTVLWAPSLRVIGSQLLSSDDERRDIRRIVAEGPKTTFMSGKGRDLVEVWGHKFDFDLKTRRAGSKVFVNLHIELDGAQTLDQAHSIGAALPERLDNRVV